MCSEAHERCCVSIKPLKICSPHLPWIPGFRLGELFNYSWENEQPGAGFGEFWDNCLVPFSWMASLRCRHWWSSGTQPSSHQLGFCLCKGAKRNSGAAAALPLQHQGSSVISYNLRFPLLGFGNTIIHQPFTFPPSCHHFSYQFSQRFISPLWFHKNAGDRIILKIICSKASQSKLIWKSGVIQYPCQQPVSSPLTPLLCSCPL